MSLKFKHWQPGIVIGLGGTGIRTLRYLKWHIANDSDGELAQLYHSGGLKLIGIDTDPQQTVEDLVVGCAMWQREDGSGMADQPVPKLDDEFILISTEAIENGLAGLRHAAASNAGDLRRHALIASWFPRSTEDGGVRISLGQAKEGGAGQWRVLGRLAFFQEAHAIQPRFKAMVSAVSKSIPHGKRLPIQIVGSLAGGTGSGMFWDTAFLLRLLAPRARITGNFLLPEVFADLADQPNADANTYAALKEIAHYKNLQQETTFEVEYPIDDGDNVYQGIPGGAPVFDTVFLYNGFRIMGHHSDRAQKVLSTTNYRIAENILARQRVEIESELNKSTQNVKGDSNAIIGAEGGFNVFSTSSTVSAVLRDLDAEARRFTVRLLQRLKIRLNPESAVPGLNWPVLEMQDVDPRFLSLENRGNAEESAHDALVSLVVAWADALPPAGPSLFSRAAVNAEAGMAEQERIAEHALRNWDPARVAKEVHDAYTGHIEPLVRNEWARTYLGSLRIEGNGRRRGRRQAVAVLGTHADLYTEDLEMLLQAFRTEALNVKNHLNDQGKVLSRSLREILEALVETLKGLPPVTDGESLIKALKTVGVGERAATVPATTEMRDYLLRLEKAEADAKVEQRQASSPPIAPLASMVGAPRVDPLRAWLWKQHEIKPHPAFYHVRISLGVFDRGDERDKTALIAHNEQAAVGPVHLALFHILKSLDGDWKALAEDHAAFKRPAKLAAAVIHLARRKDDLIAAIQNILDASRTLTGKLSAHSEKVSDRIDQIASDGLSQEGAQHLENALVPARRAFDALPPAHGHDRRFQRLAERLHRTIQAAKGDDARSINTLPLFSAASKDRTAAIAAIKSRLETPFKLRSGPPPRSGVNTADGEERWPYFAWAASFVDDLFHLQPEKIGLGDGDFDRYLEGLMAVAKGFINYWLTEPNVIKETVGNQDHVDRLLDMCRVNVFAHGREMRRLQKDLLVVVPPRFTDHADGEVDLGEFLKTQYASSASRKWSAARVAVTAASQHYPIIYYEELYRTGREIGNIHSYHSAYHRHKENRRLFHVLPGGEVLPELTERFTPKRFIRCGNPDCTHDISTQPRTDIYCDKCKRPIRNRCGNQECDETNLQGHLLSLDPLEPHQGRDGIPFKCPACHNKLKTYWWECEEHPSKHIARSETVCPDCIAEHRSGRRRLSNVRSNPDRKRTLCPGCLTLGLGPLRAFEVPGELVPFFENGVSPVNHERFRELTERLHVDPHTCVNDSRQRHFLFPTCTTDRNRSDRRHHLHRGETSLGDGAWQSSGFRCSQHPEIRNYWECYHCGYPITAVPGRSPGQCPRCLRLLEICYFCSPATRQVYEPVSSPSGGHERCPCCSNLMQPLVDVSGQRVIQDLHSPAFCRNLFGCIAAANPWRTAAERNVDDCCDACYAGTPPPPLPFGDLQRHVERCPFCLYVLGLARGSMVYRLSPREVLYHFTRAGHQPTPERCVICNTSAVSVLKWFLSAKGRSEVGDPTRWLHRGNKELAYYGKPFQDSDVLAALEDLGKTLEGSHYTPDIDAEIGMEMLEALVSNHGNDDKLADHFAAMERDWKRWPRFDAVRTMESLFGLFEPERTSIHTLKRRWKFVEDALDRLRDAEDFRPRPR